jgi:hypothetical protein
MKHITFEIKSFLRFHLDLTEYPELSSKKKFIQKGINILRQYTPKVLKYLSRQQVLANLKHYQIKIKSSEKKDIKRIRHIFKLWIRKEISKRFLCLLLEALVIPFTGLLAILPGPNFFFYVPALLFYYHLVSYLGLKKIEVEELDIRIIDH